MDQSPQNTRSTPAKKVQRSSLATCCIVFVAVLMPPLAVFEIKGCNGDFWINFLLTLLAYFPGLIHAVYIIIKYPDQLFGFGPDELEQMERAQRLGQPAVVVPAGTQVIYTGEAPKKPPIAIVEANHSRQANPPPMHMVEANPPPRHMVEANPPMAYSSSSSPPARNALAATPHTPPPTPPSFQSSKKDMPPL